MKTVPVTHEDVLYVAQNMRDWDKREIYATRWREDPADVALDCMRVPDFAWTIHLDKPVCAIGAVPMHPGVWSVWMFATDEFPKIGIYATKFVKRIMIPALTQTASHRAQCLSVEGHDEAQKWLRFLGAKPECRLREYGRNKEDFLLYVWSK